MKKINILLLILALIQINGFSQFDISLEDITGDTKSKPKEATKEKAKEADLKLFQHLSQHIYVIEQEYILSQNGAKDSKIGLDGEDYFGKRYGISVLSKNNLWLESNVNNPWNGDPNYIEFANDSLIPSISNTNYRRISPSTFQKLDAKAANNPKKETFDYLITKSLNGNLLLNNNQPINHSWLITFYGNPYNSAETMKYSVEELSGDISSLNGSLYTKSDDYDFLGGIIIVSQQLKPDAFRLYGILAREGNAWYYSKINKKKELTIINPGTKKDTKKGGKKIINKKGSVEDQIKQLRTLIGENTDEIEKNQNNIEILKKSLKKQNKALKVNKSEIKRKKKQLKKSSGEKADKLEQQIILLNDAQSNIKTFITELKAESSSFSMDIKTLKRDNKEYQKDIEVLKSSL